MTFLATAISCVYSDEMKNEFCTSIYHCPARHAISADSCQRQTGLGSTSLWGKVKRDMSTAVHLRRAIKKTYQLTVEFAHCLCEKKLYHLVPKEICLTWHPPRSRSCSTIHHQSIRIAYCGTSGCAGSNMMSAYSHLSCRVQISHR
jgi:hypothetical protein